MSLRRLLLGWQPELGAFKEPLDSKFEGQRASQFGRDGQECTVRFQHQPSWHPCTLMRMPMAKPARKALQQKVVLKMLEGF